MTSKPFTTCLWFDNQGGEAARYYVSIFNNSRLGGIHCYTSAGPGEEGAVMLVEFELNGQKFVALNGGPQHAFNPAVSIVVECADQAEVDYHRDRLTDGGQEIACGWAADKYGLLCSTDSARTTECTVGTIIHCSVDQRQNGG
jgi:predicted 3-demethylubiquinone-9 3-methyltransferase (glyoxalase superfamily)